MTELFGPKVAIVDDRPEEVAGIIDFMEENKVGYQYFNADIIENNYPLTTIESVELVFLDLYYSSKFDPYQCAQWIDHIIPSKQLYELIVWSKDSNKTDEVISVLNHIEKTPRIVLTKQKNNFQDAEGISRLIAEIKEDFQENRKETEEFIAEIIEISENFVVLNCLLDSETEFYQIRRFEKSPLSHFTNLKTGGFMIVRITTEPGERKFEFIEDFSDHSKLFEQKNIFLKFKDSPLFKKALDDEDNF